LQTLLEETAQAIRETGFLAKTDFQLGRMHVDIDVASRQGEEEKGHRMSITRQQRTIGFVQGMAQGTILCQTAVDKEELLAAGGAMEGRLGNVPLHLQALFCTLYRQQVVVKTDPEQRF
jgi:hypothetical protein